MNLLSLISLKKSLKYIAILFISLFLINCQSVLKAPTAKIFSATLPTPVIDTEKASNYPKADFNLQVTNLQGEMVKMENYKGKVIFLNFWATWCMPCVAELPSIDKLYQQFKNDDMVFFLISKEKIDLVKDYKHRKNYEVPFFINDSTSSIPVMYHSPGIPTTFIINKKGQVIKASAGAEDWDDKEFIQTVKELVR